MPVVIGEIVTETVVAPSAPEPAAGSPTWDDAELEVVVRRATDRVLEILRREWDR